ncbi:MAG: peptidase M3, partial [Oscillospiraceae bacterium]|nr:peptidase M3 [Oscillospiraceae bacterium]
MDIEKVKNGEWSLTELYEGYDDPAFTADLREIDRLISLAETQSLALEGDPKDVLCRLLDTREKLTELIGKLGLYISLRQSACTTDARASSLMDQLSGKLSMLAAPETRMDQYVAGLGNLEELIAADPLLTDYAFLLRSTKDAAKYLLSAECEEIISLYENSGSSAWGNLQSYLTSTVPVQYRGGTITLSDVRNLAYDPDPQVRKDAFHAELAAYERIRDAVAFSLNSIKLEVLNRCRLRGFESPLAETLYQSHVSASTLDALLTAIREYLPRLQPFYRHKAKLLGHEGGLPWYDLFAPLGAADEKYTKEEARAYLIERFSSFDGELTEMVRTAFDEGWIDFYPREGKVGGAFCAEAFSIRASRILTNFAGSFNDVVTLAHELGHAFHDQNVFPHRPLNRGYSMPVAETASTFNENVVVSA